MASSYQPVAPDALLMPSVRKMLALTRKGKSGFCLSASVKAFHGPKKVAGVMSFARGVSG